MSVTLEIPQHLFERIKRNAIPFVDLTPASVLERWADYFDKPMSSQITTPVVSEAVAVKSSLRTLDPISPPNLLHTRCRGTFGTVSFRKWNDLVRLAHIQTYAKAGSFESLLRVSHAQLRKGDHSGDSGFHFVPEIGLSIQGVDANKAWEYSLHLAQYLKAPLSIRIDWRNKKGAAFPGETALLEWRP